MKKHVFWEKVPVHPKYSFFLTIRYNLVFIIPVLLAFCASGYGLIVRFHVLSCVAALLSGIVLSLGVYKYLHPPITLKNDGFVDYSHSSKGVGFVPWSNVKDISFLDGDIIAVNVYDPAGYLPWISPDAQQAHSANQPLDFAPLFLIVPEGYQAQTVLDLMQEYLKRYRSNPATETPAAKSPAKQYQAPVLHEQVSVAQEMVVKQSGIARYQYIIMSLPMIAASVYLLNTSRFWIGVVGLVFFVPLALIFIWTAFRGPLLILTAEGFTDNSSAVAAGFIPWDMVSRMVLVAFKGQISISVYLKNPQAYVDKLSLYKKHVAEQHLVAGYGPVNINLMPTSMRPQDILARMIALWEASKRDGSYS